MQNLVDKYAKKLEVHGLCGAGKALVGGLDAEFSWSNPKHPLCSTLEEVFSRLNINSILFAPPAEPYSSIIDHLARQALDSGGPIRPQDSESRTFLHDIPVAGELSTENIVSALKRRKCIVVPGRGIVAFGTVSPEQAFVVISSVCFACYVKFFSDCLASATAEGIDSDSADLLRYSVEFQEKQFRKQPEPELMAGPFPDSETVIQAMIRTGKLTVDHHLVDSFFGNISYRLEKTIFISQTGSSLDELAGCIDPCKLDGSSCAGITASSELTAHREVLTSTQNLAVLHGHPKFAVIISMFCEKQDCPMRGQCHTKCPESRFFEDIPIVPGEVGTGPRGLCNTLPPAMQGRRGVIVYGHGLFTVGKVDYADAFRNLASIEKDCFKQYKTSIPELLR